MRRKNVFSGMYFGTGQVDNDAVGKFLLQLRDLNKLNKVYKKNIYKEGITFIDSVIKKLNISINLDAKELKYIPLKGSFITISNHPFGGIDGLILLKILHNIRPDFKLLTNSILCQIEPLCKHFLGMNENYSQEFKFIESARQKAQQHLEQGQPLGIFPAAEISKVQSQGKLGDKQWKTEIIDFIKTANVPIIPIYFEGNNSWVFNLLSNLKPLLVGLPEKYKRSKVKKVKIKIGKPIESKQLNEFDDIQTYGRFLRVKTYALGTSLEVTKFFKPRFIANLKKPKKIISPIAKSKLRKEVEIMKQHYHLFDSSTFSVFCVPPEEIPNMMTEIGRLREITFREIGEGSNRKCDLDEFDLYFKQLIVWDNEAERIAGGYRVGHGYEILEKYGISGFYFQTLFKVKPQLYPILEETLELGRSFIVKDYQRRPLSLFLLWKGILYYLLKNNDYRYLLGPVSISNSYSQFSKNLIVEFFKANFLDKEKAQYIKPRKEFKIKKDENFDKEIFHEITKGSVAKLDKFIQDIEPDYRTPVLFKKYVKINGKLLGFNVDPKFNYCVDGLVLLDIFDVPGSTLEALSKELDDKTIMKRFKF